MKTAIYIEDGVVQLVITPESEFEKSALGSFSKDPLKAEIFNGTFYDCRGGWTRQSAFFHHGQFDDGSAHDTSLILRMTTTKETP